MKHVRTTYLIVCYSELLKHKLWGSIPLQERIHHPAARTVVSWQPPAVSSFSFQQAHALLRKTVTEQGSSSEPGHFRPMTIPLTGYLCCRTLHWAGRDFVRSARSLASPHPQSHFLLFFFHNGQPQSTFALLTMSQWYNLTCNNVKC